MRFDRNTIHLAVSQQAQRGLWEGVKYVGAALIGLSTIGVVWALLRGEAPTVAAQRPAAPSGIVVIKTPPPEALPKRISGVEEPAGIASALLASEARAEPAQTPSPSAVEAELSRRIASLQSSTGGATLPLRTPVDAVRKPNPAIAPAQAVAPAQASAPPSAAPAPAMPNAPPEIAAADQADMMSRVSELIARGDIAGARVILTRLDRAGNGRATFALGQTYDPFKLQEWNVRGIRPDADKAIEFYRRALDLGVSAAQSRLTALNSAPR